MVKVRRITVFSCMFATLDDLVPLYPLYALYFSRHGISDSSISLLFIIWAVSTLILEMPFGVLADHFSRRLLLAAGALLKAAGYTLWLMRPDFAGFAIGFAMWGAKTALTSGSLDALVYDALDADGNSGAYPQVAGRAGAAQAVALLASAVLAVPLYAAGGYRLVGWTSVAITLLTIPVIAVFPEHRTEAAASATRSLSGYFVTFRAAIAVARSEHCWKLVLICSALLGLIAFDDYIPLYCRASGMSPGEVALAVLIPSFTMIGGGLIAARYHRASGRTFGIILGIAGAATALTATASPYALGAIGLYYAAYRWCCILAQARLQENIPTATRATVTSMAALGSQICAVIVFALFAMGGNWLSIPDLLALSALIVVGVAVAAYSWLPGPAPVELAPAPVG